MIANFPIRDEKGGSRLEKSAWTKTLLFRLCKNVFIKGKENYASNMDL